MPHLVVDYAVSLESQLEISTLLLSLDQAAIESGLFESAAVKTRAQGFMHYTVAGKPQAFVHVCARILSGRSSEQKLLLSQQLLGVLASQVPGQVSRTVEVVEKERSCYLKG
ncbi:5-carboxymethyl-2-hydroxymuconate isomerase [Motiliproteus coralliicola]|uniref:5-carboxymethyl-2-hydroxymuconate isomerase n=1 Tax=Motiliproteus coralliicola TaxID=2283196 RepID=A0A369WQ76_9GAMM|nr:5-carboxymethyl-2-hydroxymuconate isomerase [Motiliproteus coralliicola]RDE24230.1 5-carboxymethyl-2-hydroxymuconate isomerase [Motiliproteus coralliicola]